MCGNVAHPLPLPPSYGAAAGHQVPGFALTIFRAACVVAGRYTPTEVRSPHIHCFVVCFAVCDDWGIARLGILVLTAAHSQAAGSAWCRHACLDCTSIRGCTPIQSVPRLHYCKHVGGTTAVLALGMPRVSLPKAAKRLHTQERRLLAALLFTGYPRQTLIIGKSTSPWQAHSPACRSPPSSPAAKRPSYLPRLLWPSQPHRPPDP